MGSGDSANINAAAVVIVRLPRRPIRVPATGIARIAPADIASRTPPSLPSLKPCSALISGMWDPAREHRAVQEKDHADGVPGRADELVIRDS